MVSPVLAAKAYAAVQNAAAAPGPAAAPEGPDFGELVKSAMSDVVQTTRQAETKMAAQVQGKADLVDVVTSISSAQASLQTMLAVRDQVIAAYQQIMNMPI